MDSTVECGVWSAEGKIWFVSKFACPRRVTDVQYDKSSHASWTGANTEQDKFWKEQRQPCRGFGTR